MKKPIFIAGVLLAFIACKNDAPKSAATTEPPAATTPARPEVKKAHSLSAGDVLYVHPTKGVVLRKKPGKEGEKITTLARDGRPLKVVAAPDPANRFAAEKINGFELADYWVQVRTEDGKEGFAFAGYLSRHRPFIGGAQEDMSAEEAFYQMVSPVQGEKEIIEPTEEHIGGYRRRYADGAVFELINYNGGVDYSLTMPASVMTQQEALVIFRSFYLDQSDMKSDYDAAAKRISVSMLEGYETMTIEPKGDQLFIKVMSAD